LSERISFWTECLSSFSSLDAGLCQLRAKVAIAGRRLSAGGAHLVTKRKKMAPGSDGMGYGRLGEYNNTQAYGRIQMKNGLNW